MARRSKEDQERDYMAAFWKEVVTMQVDHGAVFGLYVHPSARPGVFVFRATLTSILTSVENSIGSHQIQIEYPNVHVQLLSACLWGMASRLSQMAHEEAVAAAARSKKGG